MGSFKARVLKTVNIQELENTQIINIKASDKTVKYRKILHTAKLFKSKGLTAW